MSGYVLTGFWKLAFTYEANLQKAVAVDVGYRDTACMREKKNRLARVSDPSRWLCYLPTTFAMSALIVRPSIKANCSKNSVFDAVSSRLYETSISTTF